MENIQPVQKLLVVSKLHQIIVDFLKSSYGICALGNNYMVKKKNQSS